VILYLCYNEIVVNADIELPVDNVVFVKASADASATVNVPETLVGVNPVVNGDDSLLYVIYVLADTV
jgi:hypothetical protein